MLVSHPRARGFGVVALCVAALGVSRPVESVASSVTEHASATRFAAPHVILVYGTALRDTLVLGGAGTTGVVGVRARWESSDTTVVRVAVVDSLATLTGFAPGTATVTASYVAAGVTWRGAALFRVRVP